MRQTPTNEQRGDSRITAPPRPLSGLTAMILAGGLGTRLRPILADRPKVLAPVAGKPFILYLLDQLKHAGCAKVVLCTGHLGNQVESALGRGYQDMTLAYSRESSPLGTGGAVALALPLVESDPFLVLNGDSYIQADLPGFAAWFADRPAQAALLLAQVADRERYGGVDLAPDGRILRFFEKGKASAGFINAGTYLLRREAIAAAPRTEQFSLEYALFPELVRRGGLWGWPGAEAFIDIGTPESYAAAETVLRHLAGSVSSLDNGAPSCGRAVPREPG